MIAARIIIFCHWDLCGIHTICETKVKSVWENHSQDDVVHIFIVRSGNYMDFYIPMRTHFWIMDYLPKIKRKKERKKEKCFSRCFFLGVGTSEVDSQDRSRSNNNNQCLASEPKPKPNRKAYLVNIVHCYYYRKL